MAKTHTKKSTKNVKTNQNDGRSSSMSKIMEEDENKLQPDEDINSGFGNYLRSNEGLFTVFCCCCYC